MRVASPLPSLARERLLFSLGRARRGARHLLLLPSLSCQRGVAASSSSFPSGTASAAAAAAASAAASSPRSSASAAMPEKRPFERLPAEVRPVNYGLCLKPDLIDFTFEGKLEAAVEVRLWGGEAMGSLRVEWGGGEGVCVAGRVGWGG